MEFKTKATETQIDGQEKPSIHYLRFDNAEIVELGQNLTGQEITTKLTDKGRHAYYVNGEQIPNFIGQLTGMVKTLAKENAQK